MEWQCHIIKNVLIYFRRRNLIGEFYNISRAMINDSKAVNEKQNV